MIALPLRLPPGADLRGELEAELTRRQVRAAFVVAGIGSLTEARLRLAGRETPDRLIGDLEILTLSGSLSVDGAHLHMSVSDARGSVTGGHACAGCTIRTTAEVLLLLLPEHVLTREFDAATGYAELSIRRSD